MSGTSLIIIISIGIYFAGYLIFSLPKRIRSLYPILNTFLVNNAKNVPIDLKLKLYNIIDIISGDKIGFTCYGLFTITHLIVLAFIANFFTIFCVLYGIIWKRNIILDQIIKT
jgi:hypothetical protein